MELPGYFLIFSFLRMFFQFESNLLNINIFTKFAMQPLTSSNSSPYIRNSSYNFSSPNNNSVAGYVNFNSFPFNNHPAENSKLVKGKINASFENRKMDLPVNMNYSMSVAPSYQDSQKFAMTASQVHNEKQQQLNFQFKRSSMGTPRMPIPQQKPAPLRNSVTNKPSNQYDYAMSYSTSEQQYPPVQTPIATKNNLSIEQYEKKVKDLQNQLKFEQKYANDLFRTNQDNKSQLEGSKRENATLKLTIQDLKSQNQTHLEHLDRATKDLSQLKQTIAQFQKNIEERNTEINSLSEQNHRRSETIQELKAKIAHFNQIYKNDLYEERIRFLNEELVRVQSQSNALFLEKTQLRQELKMKNEKIMVLTLERKNEDLLGSPGSAKLSQLKTTELTNKMINSAFQESIKHYQQDIEHLKHTIEQQNDEHRKLREQIIVYRKEIEHIKEEMRITTLRYNTEKKNAVTEKELRNLEYQNEINSLNNKIKQFEDRYCAAMKEIDKKDEFLREHLVGRAKELQLQEYIESVMKDYINTFDSRFTLAKQVEDLEANLREIKASSA